MISLCKKCKAHWHHNVDKCIYCKKETTKLEPCSYVVKGVTEVFIPSAEHKAVPYYTLLLTDEYGFTHIKKTNKKYAIGDLIESSPEKKTAKGTVGVVGCGVLGKDITKVLLLSGYKVILWGRSKDSLNKALCAIDSYLGKNNSPAQKDAILKDLRVTDDMGELKGVDLILECLVEDLKVKKEAFKKLDRICSPKTVFASNTSSLSITDLASGVSHPGRFAGIHFFNPATRMQLVEIVKGKESSDDTIKSAEELVKNLGKTAVIVKDSPCFIANRILMPYLNEALYAYSEGVAGKEDIDTTAKLALNHPLGPLQLLDLIGLDVFVEIMKNLYKATNDPKYKPCPLAVKMVAEGKLGRKAGAGFYKY